MRALALALALLISSGAQAAGSRSYATTAARTYWACDDSANLTAVTNFPYTVAVWVQETTDPGPADANGHYLAGLSPEDWTNSYMYLNFGAYGDRTVFYHEDPAEAKSCHVQVDATGDTLDDWYAIVAFMDSDSCDILTGNHTSNTENSNTIAHTIAGFQGIQHSGWGMERGGGHYVTGTGVAGNVSGVAFWTRALARGSLTDYHNGLPPFFIDPSYLSAAYMNWGETSDTDTFVDQSGNGIHLDEQNTGTENVWTVNATDGPPWFWPMGGN